MFFTCSSKTAGASESSFSTLKAFKKQKPSAPHSVIPGVSQAPPPTRKQTPLPASEVLGCPAPSSLLLPSLGHTGLM